MLRRPPLTRYYLPGPNNRQGEGIAGHEGGDKLLVSDEAEQEWPHHKKLGWLPVFWSAANRDLARELSVGERGLLDDTASEEAWATVI